MFDFDGSTFAMAMYVATLDTRKSTFEGVGRTQAEAVLALREVWESVPHLATWAEVEGDIAVRKLAAGRGYLDQQPEARTNILSAERASIPSAPPAVLVELVPDDPGALTVRALWPNVDRPSNYGTRLDPKTAWRFVLALLAGVAETEVTVKTGDDGDTYVGGEMKVFGRYAKSDLKKLGF